MFIRLFYIYFNAILILLICIWELTHSNLKPVLLFQLPGGQYTTVEEFFVKYKN